MKLRYLIPLLLAVPLMAQTAAFNGYCTQGSFPVMTSGLPSSNLFQNLIPQCQVSVFLTGTTNFASIFADANNTPLANPFTASTKGQWLFFAATQQGYDVVMSGGIKPIVYTVPVTLTDLIVGAGGGGGSGCTTSGPAGTLVASNGAGGCQPAQVEVNNTPLATPNPVNFIDSPTVKGTNLDTGRIQFACSLATASSFGCAEPDNTTIVVSGGVLSATGTATNTTNFEHNDTLLTGLFTPHSQIQIFDLNDTLPAAPSGSLNCTWQTDPSTGRVSCFVPNAGIPQMLIVPPIGGQFAFVPFGTAVPFQSSIPTAALAFTTTAAHVTVFSNGSGFPPSTNTVTYSNAVLPSYINPANVSAVYAYLWQGGNSSVNTTCDGGLITAPLQITPSSHVLSGINGTNIGTATCTFSAGGSGPRTQTFGDLPMIGLLVFYTGTPPPVQGIQIEYPLEIDLTNGALTVVNNYPTHVNPIPIVSLPAPDAAPGQFYAVNDGISNSDCTVGGGTTTVWCASNGFGGWVAFGGSQIYPPAGLGLSTGSAWATFTPSQCSAGNAATGIDSSGNAHGCFVPSGSISGMTATQVPIAASATTIASSKAVAGSGAAITTGPASSTNLDCAQFSGTTGQIADAGAPCSSSGLSGMTTGQVAIAGSSSTVTSSKPLAGSGAGVVTGPTSVGNTNCAQFTGTSGQIADSGAPCASTGLSGMTSGQVPIANGAASINTSFPLGGAGTRIVTGPAAPTSLDCAMFTGTAGQIADAGYACGSNSRAWTCQPGFGDGVNATAAATYLSTTCKNTTGSTVTITGIQCFSDNNGSSTLNATDNSANALLTGAVTCTTAFAAGTQSAHTTIGNNGFINFTYVADGVTKQSTWVVIGVY